MKDRFLTKVMAGIAALAIVQGLLWLIGCPGALYALGRFIWSKAEGDVFAEFVMKVFSIVGLLWVTRGAVIRARYFADRNINYDEVRVQRMNFVDGVFFIDSLGGSGRELQDVIHNEAYRKTVHQMLRGKDEDSVLPLWRHKWGNSIVGAISEFIDSSNQTSGAERIGYYIVPCVIRTEQHTTCLTLNVMDRETMERLQVLDDLHSAKVVVASHMDRFVVAHRAAQLFLQRHLDVYPSSEDVEFMQYTSRCFRALTLPNNSERVLRILQEEKLRRGESCEQLIDWTSDDVISTLMSFSGTREDAIRRANGLQLAQQRAQAAAVSVK